MIDGSSKKPWMIDGAGIPPNASEVLPELVCGKETQVFVYKYVLACVVDEKMDVYAYGVLLLEIITACPALDESQQSLVMWAKPLINAKNLERLLDPHLVDACDLEQLNDMVWIATQCISRCPTDRPKMSKVYNWLSQSPSEIEGYIRPGCVVLSIYLSMSSSSWDQLEGNFFQYINSLLQDSGTDFWGTGRFLAHTEKQIASHMDDFLCWNDC